MPSLGRGCGLAGVIGARCGSLGAYGGGRCLCPGIATVAPELSVLQDTGALMGGGQTACSPSHSTGAFCLQDRIGGVLMDTARTWSE